MKTKLLVAPQGIGNFSHDGEEFELDENGMIEVPLKVIDVAKTHGFLDPDEIELKKAQRKSLGTDLSPADVGNMRRSDLIAYAQEYGIEVPTPLKVDELRGIVMRHVDAQEITTLDDDSDEGKAKKANLPRETLGKKGKK